MTFNRTHLHMLVQTIFLTYLLAVLIYLVSTIFGSFDKEFYLRNMIGLSIANLILFLAIWAFSYFFHRAKISLPWPHLLIFSFVLTFIVSLRVTDFSFLELIDEEGSAGAARLFSGLIHMNFSLLPEAVYEVLETIFVAFLATSIAIPIAFVTSFFCAKNLMRGPVLFSVYAVLRAIFNLSRSVEPLIWAVIFSVWVGIGPFAGMLALMVHSVASLAKQYSEIIENAAEGPIEAIRATGANEIQVIWFGVVPQVTLPFIAFTFYRWDINVRMATVIGLVGGGGIGTLLMKYQGQAMWSEVGCIILVIAMVVWIMDAASAYVREALK